MSQTALGSHDEGEKRLHPAAEVISNGSFSDDLSEPTLGGLPPQGQYIYSILSSLALSVQRATVSLMTAPRSLLDFVDRNSRVALSLFGMTSTAIINRIALLIRSVTLVLYYLYVWFLPALILGIVVFLAITWLTIIIFVILFNRYVPKLDSINVAIPLLKTSFVARELWTLPDRCHRSFADDQLRYVPDLNPPLIDFAMTMYSSAENECGLSDALMRVRTEHYGVLLFPAGLEEANTTGLLPWTKGSQIEELQSLYINKDSVNDQFRGQHVDFGISMTISSESTAHLDSIDWSVDLYCEGDQLNPRRRSSVVLRRPSRMLRIIRRFIEELGPASVHNRAASVFNSTLTSWLFFDLPPQRMPWSDASAVSVEDIRFLLVRTSHPNQISHLELVLRPRLQGKTWFLATHPFATFTVLWAAFMTGSFPILFTLSIGVYAIAVNTLINVLKSSVSRQSRQTTTTAAVRQPVPVVDGDYSDRVISDDLMSPLSESQSQDYDGDTTETLGTDIVSRTSSSSSS